MTVELCFPRTDYTSLIDQLEGDAIVRPNFSISRNFYYRRFDNSTVPGFATRFWNVQVCNCLDTLDSKVEYDWKYGE